MSVPTYKGRRGLPRLLHATKNSWNGLRFAATGSAFRQELALAIVLFVVAWVIDISRLERLLLIASLLLVLIVELLNSAIEVVVDRISPDHHELSKCAKDLGSAAVFLALVLGALGWITVVWPLIF